MTSCLTCWRNSPTGPRCDTCTKGDGLNAPMKPWDGSHPPPKEKDETMTDYTERFRTLSISQMQQVLAALCELATDPWVGHAFKGRIDVILAQTVGRTWEQLFASKYDGEPSRIIRSGDLVVGKRYRILEVAEWDHNPSHRVGDVVTCDEDRGIDPRRSMGGASAREAWLCGVPKGTLGGTYVTAVELVEDEQHPRGFDINAEECQEDAAILAPAEAVSPCDVGGSCGCAATADPTIIRAAEGVTLEPGEYEDADGARWKFSVKVKTEAVADASGNCFWRMPAPIGLVEAVRRVDPKPASEPVAPAASGERAIVVGSTWRWSLTPGSPVGELRTVDAVDATHILTLKPDGSLGGDWRGSPADGLSPEADFRENHQWVSDPAPPQQPAERVEPVADMEARVHYDTGISRVDGKLQCEPEECHKYQTKLIAERDTALATVAKLNALLGLGDVPDEPAEYAPSGYGAELERVVSVLLSADWDVEKTVGAAVARLVAQVNEERATVAKLTVELEAARAESATLRERLEATEKERYAEIDEELTAAGVDITAFLAKTRARVAARICRRCGASAHDGDCLAITLAQTARWTSAENNNFNIEELRLSAHEAVHGLTAEDKAIGDCDMRQWCTAEAVLSLFERAEQAEQEAERLRSELESARAGLDPKACGELIATVRNGIGGEGGYEQQADDAHEALDKLAAMLGVTS